jgi:hypothetical protein
MSVVDSEPAFLLTHTERLPAVFVQNNFFCITSSVVDPDPKDPYVFGPSVSVSEVPRYGSGSFCPQAKIVRKTLIPTVL